MVTPPPTTVNSTGLQRRKTEGNHLEEYDVELGAFNMEQNLLERNNDKKKRSLLSGACIGCIAAPFSLVPFVVYDLSICHKSNEFNENCDRGFTLAEAAIYICPFVGDALEALLMGLCAGQKKHATKNNPIKK